MRTARTYYEILGLPRSATLVQIRRRYKELVRKYHPDVAADKQMAHRLFLQIREAYEVLSDTARRKSYDSSLDTEHAARTVGAAPSRKATPTTQLLKDAQWAFIQRRFSESVEKSKEVLRSNPRNARAYAIMGDAYRAQGKVNSAIKAYSYAIQYDPADRDSQRKLDKLIGKKTAATKPPRVRPSANASRTTLLAIWWSVAFFLVLLVGVYPGTPMLWLKEYIPPIALWSLNLVTLMAAASCVVGMLLCMSGLLRNPDQELVFENTDGNWAVIPTGLILLIGSGFFFIGAAGFYMVVGLLQGSLSRSVLTVFVGVAGVVLLTSVLYLPEARHQVLMYGGNVAFISMLLGWHIGAMFKPLSDS